MMLNGLIDTGLGIDPDMFKWILGGFAAGSSGIIIWLMKHVIASYRCQIVDLRHELDESKEIIKELIGKMRRQ